ncbi:hypothetical protein SBRY_100022 [Actinacidiphila bryophytorum]|uniref:Uncharacterized protein n=1 Tax=Actinacidiphila bryophytorum TaxID=1436133 RepID=A0A9W4GYC4_9ACTN|nr:hypothetical protein SBRY_100022 [Actinacidiphila bryophytorum]
MRKSMSGFTFWSLADHTRVNRKEGSGRGSQHQRRRPGGRRLRLDGLPRAARQGRRLGRRAVQDRRGGGRPGLRRLPVGVEPGRRAHLHRRGDRPLRRPVVLRDRTRRGRGRPQRRRLRPAAVQPRPP